MKLDMTFSQVLLHDLHGVLVRPHSCCWAVPNTMNRLQHAHVLQALIAP